MPDYLVTMDTGEQYLMHHGVKGQKWGTWNAETAARRAGKPLTGGGVVKDDDDPGITEDELKRKLKNGEISTEEYNEILTKIGEYNQTPVGGAKKRVSDVVKKAMGVKPEEFSGAPKAGDSNYAYAKNVTRSASSEDRVNDVVNDAKKNKRK